MNILLNGLSNEKIKSLVIIVIISFIVKQIYLDLFINYFYKLNSKREIKKKW